MRIWSRETRRFSPVSPVSSRVSLSRPFHSPHSGSIINHQSSIWGLLAKFLPLSAIPNGMHPLIYTANRQPPSGEPRVYRGSQLRSDGVPRVRRHRASSQSSKYRSSSNGCCLFRCHHEAICVRISFPTTTTTIGMVWYGMMCDKKVNDVSEGYV